MKLNKEQQNAVNEIMNAEYVSLLLTGNAGTGKSYLIKYLLKNYPEKFTICATTGLAALNVGGCTVDKTFSINRNTWKYRSEFKLKDIMRYCPDYIIIDEASMIGSRMAELIFKAAIKYKKKIILVGDFAQAAPVKDSWAFKHPLFAYAKKIHLKEVHRQDDENFIDMLNNLRWGNVNKGIINNLSKSVSEDNDIVRLFATNRSAKAYNLNKVNKLNRELIVLNSYVMNNRYPVTDTQIENSKLAHNEPVCVGAKVLLTKNDLTGEYVNGDSGYIREINDNDILVEVQRNTGNFTVRIERYRQEVKDAYDKTEYTIYGFPLQLGYAITIHKSQGMTLDGVCVDLSDISLFHSDGRHGLMYVALSRVRNMDNLYVNGYFDGCAQCAAEVKEYMAVV